MTQPNKPGPSWEKEGLHFKACRINGEAYVELFEGKSCLALIKTIKAERKEWWPGIYEDACKEAERLNEQLRSRRAQEKAAAPGEEEFPPDDVCCCGDSMENHPSPMECGHEAVSQFYYYQSQASAPVEEK